MAGARHYLGCDLGSTTGKAVVLRVRDGAAEVAAQAVERAGLSPEATARSVIERACGRAGVARGVLAGACATGYGRQNVRSIPRNASEISCHARGAHFLRPTVRTIVDVGGQDVKAISVTAGGKVADFTMNDKCAAGTGKFFEAMARTLDVDVEELGRMALAARDPVTISSTCSVFAESEVVTAINKGLDARDIAGGIHESIARRLVGMVRRVGLAPDVMLTGGCAKNPGLAAALERMLGLELVACPIDPQVVGALGAALVAAGPCAGECVALGNAVRPEPAAVCAGCGAA